MELVIKHGLHDRTIGVFTWADEVGKAGKKLLASHLMQTSLDTVRPPAMLPHASLGLACSFV